MFSAIRRVVKNKPGASPDANVHHTKSFFPE